MHLLLLCLGNVSWMRAPAPPRWRASANQPGFFPIQTRGILLWQSHPPHKDHVFKKRSGIFPPKCRVTRVNFTKRQAALKADAEVSCERKIERPLSSLCLRLSRSGDTSGTKGHADPHF